MPTWLIIRTHSITRFFWLHSTAHTHNTTDDRKQLSAVNIDLGDDCILTAVAKASCQSIQSLVAIKPVDNLIIPLILVFPLH